jgi:glycosyltransferase involved in cell wall biosynthesis
MRVLQLTSGDLWAGAEVSVSHVVREMASRPGHDVRVVLLNDGVMARTLLEDRVPVDVVPEDRNSFTELARSISAITRRFGADVVHTHRYKESILGEWAAARSGALHVRTAHGRSPVPDWRSPRNALARWTDDKLADWTGSVWIAVSEDLAASIRGLRRSVHVVPNGIPVTPPEPARGELLAACGEREAFLVGFVGRLENVKRPDRFLRVVRSLPRRVGSVPVAAVIVGSGSMHEAVALDARALGSGPRVTLVAPVPHGDRLVASLDVLVVSSDSEGLPMVVLEAMRSSVAIAATCVGGLPEALGSSRWLVPPDDEATLAARVTELVVDAATNRTWGEELRRRFVAQYAIGTTVDRILDVYALESGNPRQDGLHR